jgi:hypothetical protein
MGQKIKLDDKEYDVENLSDRAKTTLASLQFATTRIQELNNMHALLQCAKNSYVESLKREMLSNKAGFLFEDD